MRSHSGDRLSWHPGAVLKQAASSLRFVLFLLLTGSCPWSLDLFPGPGEASLVNKHSFLFLPGDKGEGKQGPRTTAEVMPGTDLSRGSSPG